MEFQGKTQPAARPGQGARFLSEAKHKHQQLFRDYVGLQGEFADLQQYTDALATDAWKLTEQIAKQSWRNGVAKGEGRRDRS